MLKGKITVVTGGARGIGKAIAQRFAQEGNLVVIPDILEKEVQKTVEEIASLGGKAAAMKIDARDGQQVKECVERIVKQWGRIDILINNIGWNKPTPFLESDESLWRQILDLNFLVPLRFCHAVLPHMIKKRYGRIVSISSQQARRPAPMAIPYSTAKAGIICMTRSLAVAMAKYNIRINCVLPGSIETDLFKQLRINNPEYIEDALKSVPMGRAAPPEEVASVVFFLASEESSYMTGQSISVDGGNVTL